MNLQHQATYSLVDKHNPDTIQLDSGTKKTKTKQKMKNFNLEFSIWQNLLINVLKVQTEMDMEQTMK